MAGVVLVTAVAVAIWPDAGPVLRREDLVLDTVVQGDFVRDIRAAGTLVPDQIRYLTAAVPGRVERRMVEPGTMVDSGAVILVLSNPDVQIRTLDVERQLANAEAALTALRTELESRRLTQLGVVAQLEAQLGVATRQSVSDSSLGEQRLIAEHDRLQSAEAAVELGKRYAAEQQRLALFTQNSPVQLRAQEEQIARLRAVASFQHSLEEELAVRASAAGIVQEVALDVGQWAQSGSTLAVVVPPGRLHAELQVPEVPARDVTLGQPVAVDTRSGLVTGTVRRIDPGSRDGVVRIEVALPDSLPRVARADLAVDGAIEVERTPGTTFIARPSAARPSTRGHAYRLAPDGRSAEWVAVAWGRGSTSSIEVLDGLAAGDVVILNDVSQVGDATEIRVR